MATATAAARSKRHIPASALDQIEALGVEIRQAHLLANLTTIKVGGAVIALTNRGHDRLNSLLDPARDFVIAVPTAPSLITPILMVVPLQLLAYHIAIRRGCDVDQPRNLAKSVTVE